MEAFSERERYANNPLRLLRALADLALIPVRIVDDAQDVWSEDNYPPILSSEIPVATEAELL